MKLLSAYLLASLSGQSPSKDTIKTILAAVGAEADQAQLDKLFAELEGKQIDALIAEGSSKLASVPTVAVGGSPAAGGASGSGAAAAKEEAKKEEAKEESEDEDMGFGLFD